MLFHDFEVSVANLPFHVFSANTLHELHRTKVCAKIVSFYIYINLSKLQEYITTLGCLIQGGVLINGGGGNPSKKLINGGVLINGGSVAHYYSSLKDNCNNYSKKLQISKNKNVYHFYTFDKKNYFFNCF